MSLRPRRKYNLPSTFGLPVGFDDCLTHCLCAPSPCCCIAAS